MKQAIRALREEHRRIEQLLGCLDTLLEGSRPSGEFDVGAAKELQGLFETFVDRQHQEKEEAALFPRLLQCVQRLRDEHGVEREHLERMRFNLFNASLGDPAGREAFLAAADEYRELQRRHLEQESEGLLPLAERLLSEQDDADVLAEFERVDAEGLAVPELETRLRALCDRLAVPFESAVAVD